MQCCPAFVFRSSATRQKRTPKTPKTPTPRLLVSATHSFHQTKSIHKSTMNNHSCSSSVSSSTSISSRNSAAVDDDDYDIEERSFSVPLNDDVVSHFYASPFEPHLSFASEIQDMDDEGEEDIRRRVGVCPAVHHFFVHLAASVMGIPATAWPQLTSTTATSTIHHPTKTVQVLAEAAAISIDKPSALSCKTLLQSSHNLATALSVTACTRTKFTDVQDSLLNARNRLQQDHDSHDSLLGQQHSFTNIYEELDSVYGSPPEQQNGMNRRGGRRVESVSSLSSADSMDITTRRSNSRSIRNSRNRPRVMASSLDFAPVPPCRAPSMVQASSKLSNHSLSIEKSLSFLATSSIMKEIVLGLQRSDNRTIRGHVGGGGGRYCSNSES